MIKRTFDFTSSLIGLIVLFPILFATAIAIKADSKGPILFQQKRPGLNNKMFNIYKFRSMAVDTPEIESAKLGEDVSYITPSAY